MRTILLGTVLLAAAAVHALDQPPCAYRDQAETGQDYDMQPDDSSEKDEPASGPGVLGRGKVPKLDTSRYLTLKQQYQFLKKLARQAPHTMKLKVVGNTKIKDKPFSNKIYKVSIGDSSDPVLLFDCGIHAREWISPATCLYLIRKLVFMFERRRRSTKKLSPKMASLFNFQYVWLPMMNPDGYMTTHIRDLSGQRLHRMHRKNRRPQSAMNISKEIETTCDDEGNCEGVDLNRNFPSGWGEGSTKFPVSSSNPWKSDYKGSHPLSEPETMALHKVVTKLKDRVLLAISIHSYGRDVYYPKGWLPGGHPDQIKGSAVDFLREFGEYFNKALNFRLGTVHDLLGEEELCGGATDDYYYSSQGINLTYTIELDPGLDNSHVGFKLPPDKIQEVGAKMWRAVKRMARRLSQMYPQHRH